MMYQAKSRTALGLVTAMFCQSLASYTVPLSLSNQKYGLKLGGGLEEVKYKDWSVLETYHKSIK